MSEDERTEARARIWRTLTRSPPTFVPTIPGGGVGELAPPPTRAQLRRRERLAPSHRPPRLRGEWMVSLAGLGYHMSVSSDRLMWSAEFDEGDRVKQIVTPRCSGANKRRARLGLACTAIVTVVLFAAVVQLEPEAVDDGRNGGPEEMAWLFTTMTFAAVLSAIATFAMLAINAMVWMGEPGLTPQFYLGEDFITPVHVAAAFGSANVIDTLVSSGANVDALDVRLRTPLHYAAMHGRKAACEVLIGHGASLSSRDDEGLFPYEVALRNNVGGSTEEEGLLEALGRPSPVLLEIMLDSCGPGADAIMRWQDVRHFMKHDEVFLADSPRCANARSVHDFSTSSYLHGATPLIMLAGSRAVAAACAQATGSGHRKEQQSNASIQWDLIVRDLVVEHGAMVDALNPFTGRTALHEALGRAHNAMLAETLLDLGASGCRASLDDGRTPLHMAARAGFVSIISKIKSRVEGTYSSDVVKGSVDPSWVDILDANGNTALHDAVSRFHVGCVRVLLGMGCDPSIPGGSGCSAIGSMYTPLAWAAVRRPDSTGAYSSDDSDEEESASLTFKNVHKEDKGMPEALLRVLLQSTRVNPNLYSPGGLAPLHLAARAGRTDTVKILLEFGADPELPCQKGRKALQYAQVNKKVEIASILGDMPKVVNALGEGLVNGVQAEHAISSANGSLRKRNIKKHGNAAVAKETAGYTE
eukprot:g2537.t1